MGGRQGGAEGTAVRMVREGEMSGLRKEVGA